MTVMELIYKLYEMPLDAELGCIMTKPKGWRSANDHAVAKPSDLIAQHSDCIEGPVKGLLYYPSENKVIISGGADA